jgi:hypothetical protein
MPEIVNGLICWRSEGQRLERSEAPCSSVRCVSTISRGLFTVLHPNAMDQLHPVQRLAFDERAMASIS